MKKSIIILLLIAGISVSAQDLSQGYYSYRMSMYNVNPGFTGNDSMITANFVTRSYLSGYDGNPRNNLLGAHGSINSKIGAGIRLMSDTKGEFEVSRYDILGSYLLRLDADKSLRFGLSAGITRRGLINQGNASEGLIDQNDPVLAEGYFNETNFIAGFGVVLNAENMKVGLSAPHLAESSNKLSENPSSADFIVASFSYRHDLSYNNIFIEPSIIYQNIPVLDNQIDLYIKADMDNKFWILAGYQTTNLTTFGAGFNLGPMNIGYIHGLPVGELSSISASLNEIMLQIKFDNIKTNKKK